MDADGDANLASLIKENAALQAENEVLRQETKEHAVSFELENEAIEPTAHEEAAWLEVQVEALKREREALQTMLCLGEELQGLQRTNVALREAARHLAEENSILQAENISLHSSSQSIIGSRAAAPSSLAPGQLDSESLLDALDRRVHDLVGALGNGDQDILMTCDQHQRKEIAAAMLKAGLFDAFGSEGMTPVASEFVHNAGHRKAETDQATVRNTSNVSLFGASVPSGGPRVVDAIKLPAPVFLEQGQETLEAVRRGDTVSKEQRKELIANMLKTGLFCAPPGPIAATAADEHVMERDQDRSMAHMSNSLNGPSNIVAEVGSTGVVAESEEDRRMRRYGREMAIKNKLQVLRTAQ
jgi:regulator of replication initiation timing